MPANYEFAVSSLMALGHELLSNRKFDLAHIRRLMEVLGNPQRRLQSVLIAGTNGKGSTAATLASIMQAAGYRTGLYTSPHLLSVNERIQVNQEAISDIELAEMYDRVESAAQSLIASGELPWHPSFFEMVTAMMFEHFLSTGVDLAVLEVGMGGRLDATNIADPCISVITDIDLDHQKFLGSTLAEIAREKAGILRPGGIAVLLPQHPQVNDALGKAIVDCNARPISAVQYMPPVTPNAIQYGGVGSGHEHRNRFPLEFMGEEIMVDSPLLGRHQWRNLALAITAAEQLNNFGFKVMPEHVEEGVRNTWWPGRFQVLLARTGFPETVLDVAHNPAGAWALRSALSNHYEDRELTFVFGAMKDKAIAEIADILFPLAERVIAVQADNPRAASTSEIAQAAKHSHTEVTCAENMQSALDQARSSCRGTGVVVITGSIYVVGQALGILGGSQPKSKPAMEAVRH
ncbi:MAG TPA: folylpolyglutamate synthase/dihydrofolate synthase family protein [Candidatus Angelobacter sp.]|nr:folylpolyglutamate synthase/dihydrofolate synthase family protein [Candidatus Angelobacter sp.]